MISLIQALIETLAQLIPRVAASRTAKEKRELGAGLFIIYIRLNEMLIAGERIIECLETYVERMQRHMEHGDHQYALSAGSWVRREVGHQLTNFERIYDLIGRHRDALQIIDGETYSKLLPLLDTKAGAITWLMRVMGEGYVPLEPDNFDLGRLIAAGWDQRARLAVIREREDHWRRALLPTDSVWTEDIYVLIVDYLTNRQPRRQLAEIRKLLNAFREALERYFSVADILLEVGDGRLDSA